MSRFWEKVDKLDDCWLWTGTHAGTAGYGRFKYQRKSENLYTASGVHTQTPAALDAGKE